ncbi:oligopeptidase B [Kordiimonas sediminis]|uniref:Oligopeptidase B n=1 Tax=Kordiimonas sediminis TaxID=1735581 RepID=A0A919E4A4_9PROT|nr:S9 family peptidase [Kordiimonas sediminis]GHF12216.1 oligopeptidase B [Kordiimonas sediminis]
MVRLSAPVSPLPPTANKHASTAVWHGEELSDNYAWLKDPAYPEVTQSEILDYLKEENAYFSAVMDDRKALTETLFSEIKGRIKDDDESVPWIEGAYEYRWAFAKGAQYRCWYRREKDSDNPWQVLLDEAAEADGKEFFRLGDLKVSPDGRLVAYSADTNGSERFTIRIKNIETGKLLDDVIEETSGEICWQSDSQALAAVKVSREWRPYLVVCHALGEEGETALFEEADTGYFVHIGLTSDKHQLCIRTADHVTAEVWVIPADDFSITPACLSHRQAGHDYYVDHDKDGFLIRSNHDHKNFGLYRPQGDGPWGTVLVGDDNLYIRGMHCFRDFIAVQERFGGLDQIRIIRGDKHSHVDFPETAYEAELGNNSEFDQSFIRISYTSMVTPPSVFDYSLETDNLTVRKEQEIPSGYNKTQYVTERLLVPARDGVKVPVSLVYKKTAEADRRSFPMHLYGYGAYGLGMSPAFSATRLSLLDRGFTYAIAHIRGGDELGYGWYEAGKLKDRTNTFNDFVDVARYLTDKAYVAAGEITISGGSAGGELMGAVLNQAPELFCGAMLHVPFVDVLNTMLNADLPLTPLEWPEWGNPIKDKDAFDHIKSYCPYTNIEAKEYPPMMVTGGLNDPRVTYWEPAKWTAKMRAMKTDDNLLLMKINMGAGHGGKSGRFDRYREVAEEYTFLLMCYGMDGV